MAGRLDSEREQFSYREPHEVFDEKTLQWAMGAKAELAAKPDDSLGAPILPSWPPSGVSIAVADQLGAELVTGGPDAFTDDDVESVADGIEVGHEYTVPGSNKKLWIFGMGSADWEEVNRRSWPLFKAVRAAKTDADQQRELAMVQPALRALQVICCCRQGPTRQYSRSFRWESHRRLHEKLAIGIINEIVEHSDSRSHSGQPTLEALRGFFIVASSCFRTLSSVLSTWDDCPKAVREQALDEVARCARFALLLSSQGSELLPASESATAPSP